MSAVGKKWIKLVRTKLGGTDIYLVFAEHHGSEDR